MENSELCIKVEIGSESTLVGFPYLPDQYHAYTEDDQNSTDNNYEWLIIDLADRTDTTAAQEQFLNSNPNVKEYTVR